MQFLKPKEFHVAKHHTFGQLQTLISRNLKCVSFRFPPCPSLLQPRLSGPSTTPSPVKSQPPAFQPILCATSIRSRSHIGACRIGISSPNLLAAGESSHGFFQTHNAHGKPSQECALRLAAFSSLRIADRSSHHNEELSPGGGGYFYSHVHHFRGLYRRLQPLRLNFPFLKSVLPFGMPSSWLYWYIKIPRR